MDVCIFYLFFLSQSNLAVGHCIPTSVTLMLISSDNPLPSDQPLKFYFKGKIHRTKFSAITVCKCAIPGHQAHSRCCAATTAVRLWNFLSCKTYSLLPLVT